MPRTGSNHHPPQMAQYPLEPMLARTMIMSEKHHCSQEVLRCVFLCRSGGMASTDSAFFGGHSIAAMLSVDNVFFAPSTAREKAARARSKFHSSEGDLAVLLAVYRAYHVRWTLDIGRGFF